MLAYFLFKDFKKLRVSSLTSSFCKTCPPEAELLTTPRPLELDFGAAGAGVGAGVGTSHDRINIKVRFGIYVLLVFKILIESTYRERELVLS